MDNTDKDVAGVGGVMTAFAKIGWTLRERGRIDYGIDADVEVKKNEEYQNKHIALQIKSGDSFLKVKKNGKISFSIDDWHYKYWLKSDRPVLIVFYDIDNNVVVWEHICLSKLKMAKTNHIIEIEPSKQLTIDSKEELEGIISNHTPFEIFTMDADCINFDYSIYCFREINTVLNALNDDFGKFRKQTNVQSYSPNSQILIKLFNDFTKKLILHQELFYENSSKSHWYIDELAQILPETEKEELYSIITKHKGELLKHVQVWTGNAKEYASLNHPNIPSDLQRAANNLVFRIKEYIATLSVIIDTQNSIQNKLA